MKDDKNITPRYRERNDFSFLFIMKLALIRKIDFKFSNLMHSALVSIGGTEDEMFVHIQLINSFIKKIFGVEHIRFSNQKGEIKVQEYRHPFVYQVAEIITSMIIEELQDTDTVTLKAV